MLYEQLRDKWHARERAAPIHPTMTFAAEGLVLGAGTILVPAEGIRRLKSLRGQEQRILALLSAAHGKAVSPLVLGNIERAGKAWSVGDDCLAYIHLAHAGLQPPADLRSAAWRLIIADAAMKAGVSARAIFQALEAGGPSIGTIEKYDPGQPPRTGRKRPYQWPMDPASLVDGPAQCGAGGGARPVRCAHCNSSRRCRRGVWPVVRTVSEQCQC